MKIKAVAFTSKWETDHRSGGVSGIGSASIQFKIGGIQFKSCVKRLSLPNKWIRSGRAYRDIWTGAVAGNYEQEIFLEKDEVMVALASIFEYEQRPLNPWRFNASMVEAIKAYAFLANKDFSVFVRGYLYPLPHPFYRGDAEYGTKREEVFAELGV